MMTITTRVKKHILRLIVPFAYGKPFTDCAEAIDTDYFETKDLQTDRLFDYAEHLVTADRMRHEAVGTRWVMRQGARKAYGLPSNFNHPITCRVKEQEWTFSITGVELYLFETQVGFLQYNIAFPDELPLDEQIEAVYYLKKLKNYSHSLHFEQKKSKEAYETRSLQLSELSVGLLSGFEPKTFFEGNRDHPTEALVIQSVAINRMAEEAEPEIGHFLFHMRRSFKSTYKASATEKEVLQHPNLLRIFENSTWGISLEGLANIVTETDDSATNQFFDTQYFHHVSNTYVYLYLLVLHQKYALLHLSNEASHLTHMLDNHRDDPAEQSRVLSHMNDRIVWFLLRSSYKYVSRSSHHAELYEWMRSRLQIEELFEEIHEATGALRALIETAERQQRMEQEEQKKNHFERFNRKITGITVTFLPLTVVTGIYSLDMLKPLQTPVWFAGFTLGAYLLTYLLFRFWFNKEE